MAVLVTAIHAVQSTNVHRFRDRGSRANRKTPCCGSTWMAVTSTAMTALGRFGRRVSASSCTRLPSGGSEVSDLAYNSAREFGPSAKAPLVAGLDRRHAALPMGVLALPRPSPSRRFSDAQSVRMSAAACPLALNSVTPRP